MLGTTILGNPHIHTKTWVTHEMSPFFGVASAHFTLQQSWSKFQSKQTVIRLMGSEIRRAPVEGKVVFFPLFIGFLQTSQVVVWDFVLKTVVYWFFHFADTQKHNV